MNDDGATAVLDQPASELTNEAETCTSVAAIDPSTNGQAEPQNGDASNLTNEAGEPASLEPGAAPSEGEPVVKESLTPEQTADAERERKAKAFDLIGQAERGVAQALSVYEDAAEEAKAAKKAWEVKSLELHDLIRRHRDPEPQPLFDKATEVNAKLFGGGAAPSTADPLTDESWKAVRLEEALPDLTERTIGLLNAAQLFTMGELAAWTAEDGGRRRLVDITGIGPGTAGKIEEATMAFWSRRGVTGLDKELSTPAAADPAPTEKTDQNMHGDMREAIAESNGQAETTPPAILDRDSLILCAIDGAGIRERLTGLKEASDGEIRLVLQPAFQSAAAGSGAVGAYEFAAGRLTITPKGEAEETLTLSKAAKAVRRILGIPAK